MRRVCVRLALLGAAACAGGTAGAAQPTGAAAPAALDGCARIERDADRLACYDRLAGRAGAPAGRADMPAGRAHAPVGGASAPVVDASAPVVGTDGWARPAAAPAQAAPAPAALSPHQAAGPPPRAATGSVLDRLWELSPETRQGRFGLRAHQANYLLLASYANERNNAPFRAPEGGAAGAGSERVLQPTEIAFQLSFKLKLVEQIAGSSADLWFGYTQQSWWQAYNRARSSPFRESNYQPELMVVMPTRFELLGLKGRFASLGIMHQSNGRSEPLSRSWNRVYAQVGLERDNFVLLVRPWYRLPERRERDRDNPDINDYFGHGDLTAAYRLGEHWLSLMARRNFRTDRGALRVDWAFPLAGPLKGYLQVFSGYGPSLIDYNVRQTTIGFGVVVNPWQ